MSWWGKVLGGAFGYMLGGPIGALLGAALGHSFDRGMRLSGFSPGDQERIQTAFFTATFSVMGHMAKADGRVSETEIQVARNIMAHMSLNEEQKKVAINLFNQGKQPDFNLDEVLQQFRKECHRRATLIGMFVEIQIHAALADGVVHAREKQVLMQICQHLGIPATHLEQLIAMVQAQTQFHGAGGGQAPPSGDVLKEAYAALGIDKSASDAEVKKAYRKLMNQHHPDKLMSRGMPEEMIKLATEKTQEIKSAYELVKKSRGMK